MKATMIVEEALDVRLNEVKMMTVATQWNLQQAKTQ
jgi:hypothetical protein